MRHHDDLPTRLRVHEGWDKLGEYRLWIQILLRLIDNQRSVVIVIKSEVQQQKNYATGPWRKFLDVNTVVRDTVSYPYVVCIEDPLREAPEPCSKRLHVPREAR